MRRGKLIEINGQRIKKSLIDRWTSLAKECYARGCNCQGCNILPELESLEECKIKDYVRAYFLVGISLNRKQEEENNDC